MLDQQTIKSLARELHQAERTREQTRQLSLRHEMTIDDAYAIQREWVAAKIAEGRVLKGHKNRPDLQSHAGQLANQ